MMSGLSCWYDLASLGRWVPRDRDRDRDRDRGIGCSFPFEMRC
jgi:hypothetical protein